MTFDDYVLVCLADGEYYNDSDINLSYCIADRFQNLTVLKLTRVFDDYVYGDTGNGIEIKIPSSNVFKLPEGWVFASSTNSESEPGPSTQDHDSIDGKESNADETFISAFLSRIIEEYSILDKLYRNEQEKNLENCDNYIQALETIKELQTQIMSISQEKELYSKITTEKLTVIERTYERRITALEDEIDSLKKNLAQKEEQTGHLKEKCAKETEKNEQLKAKYSKLEDQFKEQQSEKRKKNFVKVPLPTLSSSQVSTKTLNERVKSLHRLLKLLSSRGDSNESDEISITLGHYLKKHPEITLKAMDIAGISVNSHLSAGQSLDLKLLLKLPMYRLRELRSYLKSIGIDILASERTIRAEMDKRNEGKDVHVYILDMKAKASDDNTSKVAIVSVVDPELHLGSTVNSSLQKGQLRIINDNEIWCKIGKELLSQYICMLTACTLTGCGALYCGVSGRQGSCPLTEASP